MWNYFYEIIDILKNKNRSFSDVKGFRKMSYIHILFVVSAAVKLHLKTQGSAAVLRNPRVSWFVLWPHLPLAALSSDLMYWRQSSSLTHPG